MLDLLEVSEHISTHAFGVSIIFKLLICNTISRLEFHFTGRFSFKLLQECQRKLFLQCGYTNCGHSDNILRQFFFKLTNQKTS